MMGIPSRLGSRLQLALLSIATCMYAQAPASSIADETTAFQQARARTASEQRIDALSTYLRQFPSGSHSNVAEDLLLKTYLAAFPGRTAPIHTLAAALVASAPPGFERWNEQATIAGLLAAAKPKGADLPDAQAWAQNAVDSLTEPAYRHEIAAAQIRFKLPKLTSRQIHDDFIHYRATFLATAAHVSFDEQQMAQAATLLTEAARLNPLNPEVNLLQGELALAHNQPQIALTAFERADAMGALDPDARQQELQLYKTLQHGDAAALDREVDDLYRNLYPSLYTLPPRQLPAGGHTALLELFSGTGCAPCAGPDLAIESLLATYTRQDLAVLEFDEHIPRPDPLTIPDSVTRAAFYGADTTPVAFLDGQPLQILGASRQDVENIVIGFADAIETQAALPCGLRFTITSTKTSTGDLRAQITLTPVTIANQETNTGDTSLRSLARAQLFAALVQNNLRYSGKSGIRFHRMVVRALQQAPAANFLSTNLQPRSLTFEPGAIEQANTAYLTDYESTNDRFGVFKFPTTSFPLSASPLALVVWVQNPVTKDILQTAFTPIP